MEIARKLFPVQELPKGTLMHYIRHRYKLKGQNMCILPFGSVIDLNEVVSFHHNPPTELSCDVPPGYVTFKNGKTESILPGDAFSLREYLVKEAAGDCLPVSQEWANRLAAIEAKKVADIKKIAEIKKAQ